MLTPDPRPASLFARLSAWPPCRLARGCTGLGDLVLDIGSVCRNTLCPENRVWAKGQHRTFPFCTRRLLFRPRPSFLPAGS